MLLGSEMKLASKILVFEICCLSNLPTTFAEVAESPTLNDFVRTKTKLDH